MPPNKNPSLIRYFFIIYDNNKIYELLRCNFKTLMTIVPCSPKNNHIQTEHCWQLEGNKNFYFFLFFFNVFENPMS